MTTDQPNEIPSDYGVIIIFRHFKLAPANHSASRSMKFAPNTKFLCQIYERPDPIPPAARRAAYQPERVHDVRVFAKRIIFAGAGVTRRIAS